MPKRGQSKPPHESTLERQKKRVEMAPNLNKTQMEKAIPVRGGKVTVYRLKMQGSPYRWRAEYTDSRGTELKGSKMAAKREGLDAFIKERGG